ncbi:MAG: PQQ-binding-like beta-propeller repeat protein [Lentisphaerae bacterium]|nr:PQQ-binding-like beta-propeller repeat protein [Lentisphaerota bacterium]MBT5611928.1 PQQ-binding-like beta-propeller repeat protein [Lentisphaerota bacterium]MBT7057918.1 PQQ-binding-like beta-propeller repeat protein [Lentisphaerota bacterium]MBT7843695.1 PQQ-binding-like beta-propeller repeat protein [Lentisphaerota bacterium]
MRQFSLILAVALAALPSGVWGQDAAAILGRAGFTGGLVVHLGCGDGGLTVGLRANDGTVVHGLDMDPGKVARARDAVQKVGLAGAVTVAQLSGKRLPLIDNLVKLLVVSESFGIGRAEMLRVLAPNGALVVCADGKLEHAVKPRPAEIDEWTHYLRDSSNNAVARDTVVGPPRHMQWLGAPLWTRNHHKLNSISSVATANGRLFYLVDQSTAANMGVPGRWELVARDAFSGVKLWSKPIGSWAVHTIGFRSGPAQVTRLLVVEGDRVFVPLALSEPVSVVDGISGKTLATYADTKGAEEMVLVGNTLLVLTGEPIAEQAIGHPQFREAFRLPNRKSIVAIDKYSGKMRWRWTLEAGQTRPETLAADNEHVYLQVDEAVVCLNMADGSERWSFGQRATVAAETAPAPGKRKRLRSTFGKNVLVVSDGVVLCKLGKALVAVSAATGEKLWECELGNGFRSPPDIFVIDGLVWNASPSGGSISPPPLDDFSAARDLRTGEVRKRNQAEVDIQTTGHHHRCYREKATTRYIITGKRGIEMMDLQGNNHSRANWIRGTCQYGMLPANGLVYTPPHSCGCYMESKLYGFWAFSADQPAVRAARAGADPARLVKGPAFGMELGGTMASDAWPQLRGNALRNGVAGAAAPGALKRTWVATLEGKLTQPVAAGGKAVVASVDTGAVYAIDAESGAVVWRRAVGGRVDSAPTIHRGLVLFGCADGWVYCLRLSDGELVWRFLAAPADMRTVALDQVESLWPVRGSVMVLKGIAYCSSGRSTWLDGGMALYGLDPATGKVVHHTHWESAHPTIGESKDKAKEEHDRRVAQNASDYKTFLQPDRSDAFSMAGGATSDVLVSDGTNVFLRQAKFDATLRRQDVMSRHLFSTSSLLDGMENHRSHWVLGTGDFSMVPVAYSWIANSSRSRWKQGMAVPRGVMMVYTDESLWVVRRGGGSKYTLSRMPNVPFSPGEKPLPDFRDMAKGTGLPVTWQQSLNARPRAMIMSGGNLFFGTAPIAVPEDDPNAAYEGRMGGMIWVAAAKDGAKIAEYKLPAPVVWDGLSAAHGRVYAALTDGSLVCLSSVGEELPVGDTPASTATRPRADAGKPKKLPKGSGGSAAPGKPITPGKKGKLVLKPETAKTSGGLRYQQDRNNLGGWVRSEGACQWNLAGLKQGTYRVTFAYGSTNPDVAYTITAGKATLTGKTVHTGGIKTYKPHEVGTIDLSAGKTTLSIKAPELRKGALMNFRLLTLTPVK